MDPICPPRPWSPKASVPAPAVASATHGARGEAEAASVDQLPASDSDLSDRINEERSRFFDAVRWSGPVGIAAAVGFYSIIISSTTMSSAALRWWIVAMLLGVALQVAAFMVPASSRWLDTRGIPALSDVAHVLIGAGWGSVLWIDLDATRADDVRWITLAALFAVSAGVVAGTSGVNLLSVCIFVPMWVVAIGALVAVGQITTALAGAAFAVICVLDLRRAGQLWTELMVLRVESSDIAEANLWAATHDTMTSLVNRSGFMKAVRDRSSGSNSPITVMFIDLDRFKEVNDTHGHAVGDCVLIEAADRIQSSLRSTDLVGRFGGDEFCVMLEAQTTESSAGRLAHEIIAVLEKPFEGAWGPESIEISASIGVASMAPADATPERLMLDADFAMYEAKRVGRRRVVHFGRELEEALSARLGVKTDFRRLVRDRGLEADGQPIFDLQTGAIVAVELLARWRLPDDKTVPPSVFIPLAEELGLIGEVTEQLLCTAGEQLVAWRDDPELGAAKVSVNASAAGLADGSLLATVAKVMAEYGIGPGRLVLELTESTDLAGTDADLAQFEALRALGVGIAIDDFGTGYSSLQSLLSFPVQVVKVDGSLITKLGDDQRQVAMWRSINDLAGVVGQKVVVEGVETAAQLEELIRLGAPLAQGYHLCRPVPAIGLSAHVEQLRSDAASPLANQLARR